MNTGITISSYRFDCAPGNFISLCTIPSESISPAGCTKKSYKRVVGRVCIHEVVLQCFHSLYLLAECYRTQERCCAFNLYRTSHGMSEQYYTARQAKHQPGNSGMIVNGERRRMPVYLRGVYDCCLSLNRTRTPVRTCSQLCLAPYWGQDSWSGAFLFRRVACSLQAVKGWFGV